ncbi:MAG: DUF4126 domain-containing protein [Thermomicrobiales bacterium]
MDILSGFGLAGAAGLNAYIPLLLLAIAQRLGYAHLNAPYAILGSNVALGVLVVLLAVEVCADKIPGVDHVNDIINTAIRPAAGAVLVLASTGAGTLDPRLAALLGLITAGTIHATKATARPFVTATTLGMGNPVVSTLEDILSFATALLALVAPVVVVILVVVLTFLAWRFIRRRRRARSSVGGRQSSVPPPPRSRTGEGAEG